ncbi:DNA repair and recombination protein RadB [Candidatus Woesearchaeota archaeon]|nr:DNA repair and recombination protein RadB [Candidatus Woesearchaeota archaeon]
MGKISTGSVFFDEFLAGGYDQDIITTIYGPSGSGKTNLCLIAAVQIALTGKQVVFIDTEGGIAVDRIKQTTSQWNEVLERFIFFSPTTFSEQDEVFSGLREKIDLNVGLIVVDSISMLYRLALGQSNEVYDVNATLGKQIACLVEIARKKKIPVLVTNQVYADFKQPDTVKMVGGDLLKYGSKCLLELQNLANGRGLLLRKHRSLPEGKSCLFRIVGEGIEEVV